MGEIDDITNKIKGKAEQIHGDIEQYAGHGIKGGIRKIKGTVREKVADLSLERRVETMDKDY